KFDKVINIWGADHHGDVKRVKGFVEALGYRDKLEIILMQFVRLVQNGKPVRMSKREGVYVLVDDILKEITLDAFRFFMAKYSPDTHMDFDLDLAKEQSQKNPVYYVQYAYARICSILRKSSESSSSPLGEVGRDFSLLSHPSELALIKQLIRLPEIIADTARDYQVHRLPQYALDLVRSFHKFYEDCRVIDEENKDLTVARLALCEATKIVLKNTLDLMGISAPEKM
ncbi:arginine--tRNA ligase, partial [Patescibacteria group bacterium]|nr:arginine--tRNA ligase [Patescibacteria group bacterium]